MNKNHKSSRPRLALFGMGSLGGEPLGQGIPVMHELFSRLSLYFDITFYSFKPIELSKVPEHIRVRQTVDWKFLPGRLKFMFVPMMFYLDHLRKPFDCIFSVSIYPTGSWAIFLGRLFKVPVIVQIIAFELVGESNGIKGDLTKPWLKKITEDVCEKATALVAVAEYQKTIAMQNLRSKRRIDVLPLRIDHKKFPYLDRTLTGIVRFIHIGYYGIIKDQNTMFQSFARIAKKIDCHLTVIGQGYDDPETIAMLNELDIKDRISFAGMVPQKMLPDYYSTSHIMLHTARYETGCAVIQEAMASGVVVCGTRVGLLSDIGDEYAVIVPVAAFEELAARIIELIRDPAHYEQLQRRAYQWITQYGADWSAGQYHIFIKKLLSQ
jgi:glycosyltransferase involved in cell wall biosynthesis